MRIGRIDSPGRNLPDFPPPDSWLRPAPGRGGAGPAGDADDIVARHAAIVASGPRPDGEDTASAAAGRLLVPLMTGIPLPETVPTGLRCARALPNAAGPSPARGPAEGAAGGPAGPAGAIRIAPAEAAVNRRGPGRKPAGTPS